MDAKDLVGELRLANARSQWCAHMNYWDSPYSCCRTSKMAALAVIAADRIERMLARMDVEIDAGLKPENAGKAPVPASMLRVYVQAEADGREP